MTRSDHSSCRWVSWHLLLTVSAGTRETAATGLTTRNARLTRDAESADHGMIARRIPTRGCGASASRSTIESPMSKRMALSSWNVARAKDSPREEGEERSAAAATGKHHTALPAANVRPERALSILAWLTRPPSQQTRSRGTCRFASRSFPLDRALRRATAHACRIVPYVLRCVRQSGVHSTTTKKEKGLVSR